MPDMHGNTCDTFNTAWRHTGCRNRRLNHPHMIMLFLDQEGWV